MILEAILNLIKGALLMILALFPTMENLQLPTGFISWFTDLIATTSYFLPIGDFMIMFGIWFMVTNWEIIYKTIMKIWGALPFT